MAREGWYLDPGGQTGMYRYWDGTRWHEVVSPTPLSGPPPIVGVTGSSGLGSSSNPYADYQAMAQVKAKRPVGLWIVLAIGVIVVALIVWFAVTYLTPSNGGGGSTTYDPQSDPTTQVCPKEALLNTRAEHPMDDRVYGGGLSYPRLGEPWSGVETDEVRIPFGRDVAHQSILIHSNPSGKGGWEAWVASVYVGELYAGDGFYEPQRASDIVNRCIFGRFYGDEELVTPTLLRSESFSVQGYEGWITETNLSFELPNLPTTSEIAIVVIIRTSTMSSSIFFASIPNDAMQYRPDVDRAIADLRVHT